jgi:hypothetical protein
LVGFGAAELTDPVLAVASLLTRLPPSPLGFFCGRTFCVVLGGDWVVALCSLQLTLHVDVRVRRNNINGGFNKTGKV